METTARRVKAERDRQRLPHRSGMERWTLRVVFVLAPAAFLGVGVASALMILPDDEANKGPAVYSAPTAVPAHAKVKAGKHKSTRPKGPTKAQRAQRTAPGAEPRLHPVTPPPLSRYGCPPPPRGLSGPPVRRGAGARA